MTRPPTYNRRLVGWLSLAQLISWGSVFYLFALVMGPVERELELTRVQSSLAFSLCLLADGLLAFPVGRLIDKGYERAVMTVGSVLLALGLALHSQVSGLVGFYAVWVLLGAGMSMTLYTAVFAVVTRRYPIDFRRAIITMTFLGGLASTVFIPLSSWLIAELGWRGAVWVLAALNLLVCAPLHFFWLRSAPKIVANNVLNSRPEDIIGASSPEPHAATAATPVSGVPASTQPKLGTAMATEPIATTLAQHLQSAPFLLIGLSLVFMAIATSGLPTHMVTLLREYGLAEAWVIAIPASIGLLQVFGRLLLFFFEHRFNVHVANRLIPCLMPLALLLLVLAPFVATPKGPLMLVFLLAFVALWGMGNGMLTIVKGTAMAEYVSRAHVASLNGALGLPLALVRAAAPLALGWLWTPALGYRNGLVVMAIMGLAGAVALALAQRRSRQAALGVA